MAIGEQTKASSPAEAAAQPASERSGPDQGNPTRREATAEAPLMSDVMFNALRSAYTNEDREWFFSALHRLIMFVVTLSGTVAFATIVQTSSVEKVGYFALVVTVLGLIDLVFDLSGSARQHGFLRHRFLEVFGEAHSSEAPVETLNQKLLKLYADEPTTFRIVDAVAFNAAASTLGRPDGKMLVIPLWCRILRHLIPAATRNFPSREDVAARKRKAERA